MAIPIKSPILSGSAVDMQISGIVQGVGFRPFIFQLANRLGVTGWIRNTSAGVELAIEGSDFEVGQFIEALRTEAPPLASIDRVRTSPAAWVGFDSFQIRPSEATVGAFQPISPDVCVCEDCLKELSDPDDRRFRYPFINCTNCGPRFTIIEDIPYDRPNTTMAPFDMCPDCRAEYRDPSNRRYHAQPVACPLCGPQIWFEMDGSVRRRRAEALQVARSAIQDGAILAVRGMGGFHLVCDATNAEAVAALRVRKMRLEKPFAVMMPDAGTVTRYCRLDDSERRLLESRERPILLLQRLPGGQDAIIQGPVEGLAPGQNRLGVMLPYTPLHYLLVEPAPGFPQALVMTSGNRTDEPIAYTNEGALEALSEIADGFLFHDREIRTRCDDSVVGTFDGLVYPIRRARGFAPFPLRLDRKAEPILAAGGELKNTFCLARDHYAFLSHHIGHLDNYESLQAFEEAITHYEQIFRINPDLIAHDLHPEYLSTRYAQARASAEGIPAIGTQHHHAHIAACLGEHQIPLGEPAIGVAFDGTGYGEDGTIWGGEFLIAQYNTFERAYHLAPVRMPGGEAAIREPWRMAAAHLLNSQIQDLDGLPPTQFAGPAAVGLLKKVLAAQINSPLTSSMGRLFDAAASLMGVCHRISYEAQAAIELEAALDPAVESAYSFDMAGACIDCSGLWRDLVDALRAGKSVPEMSARFHNTVANMVLVVCRRIRNDTGIRQVALSGGVWLNMALLQKTVVMLRREEFQVLTHRKIPANDGGLAFGQALIALTRME